MSDVRTLLNLTFGEKIKAKVRANNAIGQGSYSPLTTDSNAGTVQTVPNAPTGLTSSNIQSN